MATLQDALSLLEGLKASQQPGQFSPSAGRQPASPTGTQAANLLHSLAQAPEVDEDDAADNASRSVMFEMFPSYPEALKAWEDEKRPAAERILAARAVYAHEYDKAAREGRASPDVSEGSYFLRRSIPFVSGVFSIAESGSAYLAARKAERGEDLNKRELLDLGRVLELGYRDKQRSKGVMGTAKEIAVQAPGFMGEFAFTGPIYSLASKAARTATKKLVAESLKKGAKRVIATKLPRAVGAIAGAAAQAHVTPTPYRELAGRRLAAVTSKMGISPDEAGELRAFFQASEDPESTLQSLVKSSVSGTIELASERAGGMLIPRRVQSIGRKIWQSITKIDPKAPPSSMEVLLKTAGFHGIPGEIAEERLGEIARGITGVGDMGAVGEAMQGEYGKAATQIAGEALGFAPIAGAGAAGRIPAAAQQLHESRVFRVLESPEATRILLDNPQPSRQQFAAAMDAAGLRQLPTSAAARERFAEDVRTGLVAKEMLREEEEVEGAVPPAGEVIPPTLEEVEQEVRKPVSKQGEQINVGDLVQWRPEDAPEFDEPRRIVSISDDGLYAKVEGESVEIPVDQLEIEKLPAQREQMEEEVEEPPEVEAVPAEEVPAIDPYQEMLGIPASEGRTPTPYELLGIDEFESDPEVISRAADERMAHVHKYQIGKYGEASQKLLNELAAAKLTLLDPQRKAEADQQLRAEQPVTEDESRLAGLIQQRESLRGAAHQERLRYTKEQRRTTGKASIEEMNRQIQEAMQSLGIASQEGLDPESLERAYRRALLRAHPDLHGGDTGPQKRVEAAKQTLESFPASARRSAIAEEAKQLSEQMGMVPVVPPEVPAETEVSSAVEDKETRELHADVRQPGRPEEGAEAVPAEKGGERVREGRPSKKEEVAEEPPVAPAGVEPRLPPASGRPVDVASAGDKWSRMKNGEMVPLSGREIRFFARVRKTGAKIGLDETISDEDWERFTWRKTASGYEGTLAPKFGAESARENPTSLLADTIANHLRNNVKLGKDELISIANQAYGGTLAEGIYSAQDLNNALEAGVNRLVNADSYSPAFDLPSALQVVRQLQRLVESIPTQTVRSKETVELQQFSTPPHYAYAVNWVANIQPDDVVLEPSAGTGGLATFAGNTGAEVHANEWDPKRAELLAGLRVQNVTQQDAEQLHNILDITPDVVVMNPPFSKTPFAGGQRVLGTDRAHIDAALKMLAPNGRLVAIIGAGQRERASKGLTEWITRVSADPAYNLLADVVVSGNVYAKYGTRFPTRVLVIDKARLDETPTVVTGRAESPSELMELLKGVRDARVLPRDRAAQQEQAKPSVQAEAARGEAAPERGRPVRGATPVVGGRGIPGPVADIVSGVEGSAGAPGELVAAPPPAPEAAGAMVGAGRREGVSKPAGEAQPAEGRGPAGGYVRDEIAGDAATRDLTKRLVNNQESTRKDELTDEVYEPYQPQVTLEVSTPHPASVVESSPMASVRSPEATYSPRIPEKILKGYKAKDGTTISLSDIQVEAIVRAGEAHSKWLPSTPGAVAYREGFMIGDGTGLGKAREAAGIILDNFGHGRRKAIWISTGDNLLSAARAEWQKIGQDPDQIFPLSETKSGRSIAGRKEGILFAGYDTLPGVASGAAKSAGFEKSRIDQIVDWVGKDFDGVLIFDESHKMANAIDQKGKRGKKSASQRAVAGLQLDERLPKARIIYMSATSATEVRNMAYATRLGLWGRGTEFANVDNFINRITEGGVAAMESVAQSLKAMGKYIARNISFNDGTEKGTVRFDRMEVKLTPSQVAAYNKMSQAWRIVFNDIDKALDITEASSRAQKNARAQFWGTVQRYFNSTLTSMQTGDVLNRIQQDLDAGNSVLIQITNTGEASQEKALQRLKEEGLDIEEFDASPHYQLIQFVQNSFPVQQYRTEVDDRGNTHKVPVINKETGKPVLNREAVQMRDSLIEQLGALPQVESPLDMIINKFGEEAVAEVTGRKRRVVVNPETGKKEEKSRKGGPRAANAADIESFMAGRKRVLVFSEAGGTGASYHASLDHENQQRRIHYVLQAGWRADTALQGIGRSHRSNQAWAPTYILVHTNVEGQKRFISTIARRLSQLGALTRGERRAGESGLFSSADNLESTEAKDALQWLYIDISTGKIPDISAEEFSLAMGIDADSPPRMEQFLNRLLAVPVAKQNRIFDEYSVRLHETVARAAAEGTLDQGAEVYKANSIVIEDSRVVHRHPSGATATYYQIRANHDNPKNTFGFAASLAAKYRETGLQSGFVISPISGKIYSARSVNMIDERGEEELRLTGVSGLDIRYVKKRSVLKWKQVPNQDEAQRLWNEEAEKMPDTIDSTVHLFGGALLPIWNKLPGATKVRRMRTDDGQVVLGKIVPQKHIGTVLRNLGVSTGEVKTGVEDLPTSALLRQIQTGGLSVRLDNGWTITGKTVRGQRRIEIVGPTLENFGELEQSGVIREQIAYKTRFFIPTAPAAAERVYNTVTEFRKVVDVLEEAAEVQALQMPVSRPSGLALPQTTPVTTSTKPISAHRIIATMSRDLDVPIRIGRVPVAGAEGAYKRWVEVVRLAGRNAGNLMVASHEVAHHIDKKHQAVRGMPSSIQQMCKALDYEPGRNRADEGFAEFVRIWLNDKSDLTAEGQVIGHWWETTFLPAHPELEQHLLKHQALIRKWWEQSAGDRIGGVLGQGADPSIPYTTRTEKIKDFILSEWDVAYTEWKDLYHPLKRMVEFARTQGATFHGETPEELARAIGGGAVAMAQEAIEVGIYSVSDRSIKIGESLNEALSGLRSWDDADEFSRFAKARHVIEEQQKRPSYYAGTDWQDAETYYESVRTQDPEKFARYEQTANRLTQFNNNLLRMLEDAGVISQAEVDVMIEAHETYIPLYRQMESGAKGKFWSKMVAMGSPIRRRKPGGSGRPVIDPIESTVQRTMRFYDAAIKGQILHSLIKMSEGVEGLGKWVEVVNPKIYQQKLTVEEILNQMTDTGFFDADTAREIVLVDRLRLGNINNKDFDWLARRYGYSIATAGDTIFQDMLSATDHVPKLDTVLTVYRPDYSPSPREHVGRVTLNGRNVMVQYHPELWKTMEAMSGMEMGAFLSILDGASKSFKLGAITLSTGFGARNLLRDWSTNLTQAKEQNALESVVGPFAWIGRYVAYKAHEVARRPGKRDEAIEAFMRYGGDWATQLGMDRKSIKEAKRKLLKRKPSEHIRDLPYAAWSGWTGAIAASEIGPRITEFVASIRNSGWERRRDGKFYNLASGKQEMPPRHVFVKAINAANDVTLNYRRIGRSHVARTANIIFPFFNAALEGTDKSARTIYDAAVTRKNLPRVFLSLASQAAAAAIYWYMRHDDDDYRESEDWLQRWWTITYDGNPILRIPRSYEWGFVPSGVEVLLNAYADGAGSEKVANWLMEEAWSRFPIHNVVVAKPVFEAAANYDLRRERPIEQETRLPPAERTTPWTKDFSKWLGWYTGQLPVFPFGPAKLEHLLNGWTGSLYDRAHTSIDMMNHLITGKKDISPADLPVLKGFLLRKEYPASVNEFYDEWEHLTEQRRSMDHKGEWHPETYKKAYGADQIREVLYDMNKLVEDISDPWERFDKVGKWQIGLTRHVQGKEPLNRYPNPLVSPALPAELKTVFGKFYIRWGGLIRWDGAPTTRSADFHERVREFNARRQWAIEFLSSKSAAGQPVVEGTSVAW